MGAQQVQLKRGVDIVVGTPGRIKVVFAGLQDEFIHYCGVKINSFKYLLQDHIERGNLDFRSLKFRVLDEVDEMLKIGFVDDVELILGML